MIIYSDEYSDDLYNEILDAIESGAIELDIEEAAESATDDEPDAGDGPGPKALTFTGAERAEPASGESSAKVAPCCGAAHGAKANGPNLEPPDPDFIRAILQYFGGIEAGLMRAAQAGQLGPGVDIARILGPAIVAQLADILDAGTLPALAAGGDAGLAQLSEITAGVDVDFNLADPMLERFLTERRLIIEETARDITETTGELMRSQIVAGLEAGESNQQIAERLEREFAGVNADRAIMIARTETANAQMDGRLMAWRQTEQELGIKIKKRWLLAPNPCEFCAAIARMDQELDLDEPFVRAGAVLVGVEGGTMNVKRDVFAPPLHPNDRCALRSVRVREEDDE